MVGCGGLGSLDGAQVQGILGCRVEALVFLIVVW